MNVVVIPFLIGLIIMLFLMLKTRFGPFLSMLLGGLIIGIGCGITGPATVSALTTGFGNTCKSIGMLIIFGSILGVYLEKSRASQRIALTFLKLFGSKNADIALAATGYMVSIPVFSDAAFVMLFPILKAMAKKARVLIGPLAVALAIALANTANFVAPTPAPLAVAGLLQLDVGKTIIVGLIVAGVNTACALLYSRWMRKKPASWYTYADPSKADLGDDDGAQLSDKEMPSFLAAILPILVPIALIVGNTFCNMLLPKESPIVVLFSFLGDANIALAIGTFLAAALMWKFLEKNVLVEAVSNAMRTAGPIVFITASGGALAKVIETAGIGKMFADALVSTNLPVLLIPFLIAALVKFAQGSGTVACTLAATLTAPLCAAGALDPVIAFASICSGANLGSHVNNSFFWVFSNLLGYDAKTGLKTEAAAQNLCGLSGLLATFVISLVI